MVSKISHLIKIITVNHHHVLLHQTKSKSSVIHAFVCSFPSMHWREGKAAAWLTVLTRGQRHSVSHLYEDKVFVPSKIWRKKKTKKKRQLMTLQCISSDRVWSLALNLVFPPQATCWIRLPAQLCGIQGWTIFTVRATAWAASSTSMRGPAASATKPSLMNLWRPAWSSVMVCMAEGRAGWSCTLARKCYKLFADKIFTNLKTC